MDENRNRNVDRSLDKDAAVEGPNRSVVVASKDHSSRKRPISILRFSTPRNSSN